MKRIIILFISIFVLLIVYVSTPSVSEEQMRTLFYEYIQRTFKEEYKKFKIISDVDLTVPGNQYHRGYAGYGKTYSIEYVHKEYKWIFIELCTNGNNIVCDNKNNIKKEGASEEFADINTEDLQKEMFAATDAGDKERAKALAAESTRRNYFKNEIAPQQKKEARQQTFSNVMNAVSGAANVAGSLFSKSGGQEQQQQKKKAPAGKLTERTKEIMRKNKKRIAALASKGYNLR